MQSDKQLVDACIKGKREAQRGLYDRFAASMLVVAHRYTKSDQEAEDVLQEAFIKVFEKIKTYREESSLGFWIKRIVVNTALNSQRSKLYMFPMVDVQDMQNELDTDFSLSQFHFKDLIKFIQELPHGCQSIFNLYAIEGYKHQEIAEMLNISVGTSKSQYSRARHLLQTRLKNEDSINYERAK